MTDDHPAGGDGRAEVPDEATHERVQFLLIQTHVLLLQPKGGAWDATVSGA
jgi:hypothetical protein